MFNKAARKYSSTLHVKGEDSRDDEEQEIKFKEIIDLLMSAGYFRARIQGLSNFDKVVGGLTWCIQSCWFDIDVDLLFRENLTIGQKIALTEKIVAMLPIMNCPYRIEPHQIQGLDSVHIFSVVEWLVKQSIKTRQEMAGFVRSFAILQFEKNHCFTEDIMEATTKANLTVNTNQIKRAYDVRRRYKRKHTSPTMDSLSLLRSTLLEYGAATNILPVIVYKEMANNDCSTNEGIAKEITAFKNEEKKLVDILMQSMTSVDKVSSRVNVTAEGGIASTQTKKFTILTDLENISHSEPENWQSTIRPTIALEKELAVLQNKCHNVAEERDTVNKNVLDIVRRVNSKKVKQQDIGEIIKKLKEKETFRNKILWDKIEQLLIIREGLKLQEAKFRDQCKTELINLLNMVKEVKVAEPYKTLITTVDVVEYQQVVRRLKLQLAKKNQALAIVTRQIDDVPDRSELTQYQRRFMELYSQVSAKHKETKQYFTLYNTLDDTKLYFCKELSLLDSIQDNYNEAMSSCSNKEQFLMQFEVIIEGVKKNKDKVEKRCTEEKSRRDALSQKLHKLMEQQRQYVAAVSQLNVECRQNEALLVQLKSP